MPRGKDPGEVAGKVRRKKVWMGNVAGIDWQGWAALSGSTIAAILTSIAALIASIAAYRKASSKDEGCQCDSDKNKST